MMQATTLIIALLAAALLAFAWRAWQNHLELRELRRNGHRRVAWRRYYRGGVHPEFLRALAELCLLVLLLAAVLGWLGAADPPGW